MPKQLNRETRDEDLARQALSDEGAFKLLMFRYKERLFCYIRRLGVLTPEDAEDILQNVFLKIFCHLNDFDERLKFSSWAYRIAHNETINELKRKKFFPATKEVLELPDGSDLKDDLDRVLSGEKVGAVLGKLDKKYRDVLILKYWEEKDYREISDILQKPSGTVATLINRAKKQFGDNYQKYVGKN